MKHGKTITLQQWGKTSRIDRERIDQRIVVSPLQLHQSETRKVRTLTMELGVERIETRGTCIANDLG